MPTPDKKIAFEWWALVGISLYLAATMVYKGTVPTSGIYPSKAVVYLTLVFQAAMTIGLFGLQANLRKVLPPADPRSKHVQWLFLLGLVSSLLLLVFRFFGLDDYAAWYTGHFWPYRG